jgi:hypothetical protein
MGLCSIARRFGQSADVRGRSFAAPRLVSKLGALAVRLSALQLRVYQVIEPVCSLERRG